MKPMTRRAAVAVALAHLFPRATDARRRKRRRPVRVNPRIMPYRWDLSRPIVIENKMGPAWSPLVRAQAAAWKQAYPRFRFRVIDRPGPCRNRKRGIVVCKAGPDAPYPGQAFITHWKREIRRVRIEMMEGQIPLINAPLLCHEFAHAFGLKHNNHPEGSCIADPSPFTTLTTPGHYDRVSLRMLYRKRGKRWP